MGEGESRARCDLGMVGLGVMGRNLLLNMADHGYAVAGYDKDKGKVEALRSESARQKIVGAETVSDFVALLRRPRAIMMLVPAGKIVDAVIKDLLPHLDGGDLIIDAGNSYFKDTDLRAKTLHAKGLNFLGVGVSGGEEGARHGPSMMPGGPKDAYQRIAPILEASAACVGEEPCVAWLGPGSAGHFVKMVHNGIEYAIMQLLAESFDLMKRGLGMNDDAIHDVYTKWNDGPLNGFLVEITGHIFKRRDEVTGGRLINEIRDVARQKGTGMWTSQSAMELQVPAPTIDLAVAMRDLSAIVDQRDRVTEAMPKEIALIKAPREEVLAQLHGAVYSGVIVSYAQGMAVLAAASQEYKYALDLETVARIWRGGCIIRSVLLGDIRKAYQRDAALPNLLIDPDIAERIKREDANLRAIIAHAAASGVPVPAMMTVLPYLDALRSVWLPANLIQAQRDYFGAHTYERIDARGVYHTDWEQEPDE